MTSPLASGLRGSAEPRRRRTAAAALGGQPQFIGFQFASDTSPQLTTAAKYAVSPYAKRHEWKIIFYIYGFYAPLFVAFGE